MMKRYILFALVILCPLVLLSQNVDSLAEERAQKAEQLNALESELKEVRDQVDALKADIAGIDDILTPYPRWTTGTFGTIGVSFANYRDWLSKDAPNTSAASIGIAVNAFANLDQKKYFWRNNGNLKLGWIKFDDKDTGEDNEEFQVSSDAFNLTSLFGYKFSENFAASILSEYRTALTNGGFNDPGYLDIGVGGTWTPIPNLVVVVHPLNYNFVFSDDADFEYMSSVGAKVIVDYSKTFNNGIGWSSNFSAFTSYEGSDLSNWTWVNSLSTSVKGIGIGFNLGLRSNKQEALAAEFDDNPLQTYWLLGLSYAFGGK